MSVSSGSYNHNHLLRRPGQDIDEDASTMPPSFHHRSNHHLDDYFVCPPPIGPLPEPSYQTQVLLGEMFSQQAVMRNYCADSIQAFMMALEDQKIQQQERLHEEEVSLALARQLQREDQMLLLEQRHYHPHPPPRAKPQQQQQYLSSDLSLDFGSVQSVSEESSSLESREVPDNFLMREAKLSAKERRGFEEEIMPFPALSNASTCSSKDLKKLAAAYCRLEETKPARCEPAADGSKKKKKRDRQCLICHRSTTDCRLRMRKLGCGHQFCRACIDRWLDTKDSCPYCRQKVSEQTRAKIRSQNETSVSATTTAPSS